MKTKLLIISAVFAALFFISIETGATPEFSLWTGNRCSECHVNFQGSGMRTEFGRQYGKDATIFQPGDFGLAGTYDAVDKTDYTYFDGLFALGTDFRFQTVRSHKTEDAARKYFPMQASLYGASDISEWLTLNGQYNFGPKIFPGQQMWAASAIIKPGEGWPMLRAGFFQPSMGIRDCDMTSLDRRVAASDGSEVLISVDFAEYGAELIYEGADWIHANLGIFDSKSLYEVELFGGQLPLILEGNPSFNARFVIYPSWFYDELPDSYIGSSFLVNGDFIYSTAFAGINLYEGVNLSFQYAGSIKPYVRHTRNYIASVSYMPVNGFFLGFKAEKGISDLYPDNELYTLNTTQMVLYSRIFLLPYLEFLPEYRFQETEEFESTRWAVQFHFYY